MNRRKIIRNFIVLILPHPLSLSISLHVALIFHLLQQQISARTEFLEMLWLNYVFVFVHG